MYKSSHERNNPVGLKVLEDIGGHNSCGHTAGSYFKVSFASLVGRDSELTDRSNDVGNNVVLGALLG
jgi:hypothetical protein